MVLAVLAALTLRSALPTVTDSARVENGRLVIVPLGLSFRIPPIWLGGPPSSERNRLCGDHPSGSVHDRIVIEPNRFAALQNPAGEWKQEFAAVVDSVMPLRALVAHLGGDPWSGTCSALQMRVYVGDHRERLALSQATAVRVAQRFFKPVRHTQRDSGEWRITTVSWDAWYHDYGGTARVEFWSRSVRGRHVVIVFLLTLGSDDQLADRADIIASVQTR